MSIEEKLRSFLFDPKKGFWFIAVNFTILTDPVYCTFIIKL